MVVRIATLTATNAAERVALPGPVAAFTEARFTRVARGDVGGAVAEDVVALLVVQAACGRPGCEQQQQGRASTVACEDPPESLDAEAKTKPSEEDINAPDASPGPCTKPLPAIQAMPNEVFEEPAAAVPKTPEAAVPEVGGDVVQDDVATVPTAGCKSRRKNKKKRKSLEE